MTVVYEIPNSKWWVIEHEGSGLVLDPRSSETPIRWSSRCEKCRKGLHPWPLKVSRTVETLCLAVSGSVYRIPRTPWRVRISRADGRITGGVLYCVSSNADTFPFVMVQGRVRFKGRKGRRVQMVGFDRLIKLLRSRRVASNNEVGGLSQELIAARTHLERIEL